MYWEKEKSSFYNMWFQLTAQDDLSRWLGQKKNVFLKIPFIFVLQYLQVFDSNK